MARHQQELSVDRLDDLEVKVAERALYEWSEAIRSARRLMLGSRAAWQAHQADRRVNWRNTLSLFRPATYAFIPVTSVRLKSWRRHGGIFTSLGLNQRIELGLTETMKISTPVSGGGSDISRANKIRKQLSVRRAADLVNFSGRCGQPTVTEGKPLLQLSSLMFEIATGQKTGSLKKIALGIFPAASNLNRVLGMDINPHGKGKRVNN